MFRIIDAEECLKIDFYPREMIPGALDRSVWVYLTPQLEMPIASRPDVVASKLVWVSKGSHKSRRDIRQLVWGASDDEVNKIRIFARELSLEPLLDEVLAEPDELDLVDEYALRRQSVRGITRTDRGVRLSEWLSSVSKVRRWIGVSPP